MQAMLQIDKAQRKRDRQRGDEGERWCQDCQELIDDNVRRIRCANCLLLLCGWCWSHTHFRGQARY